MMKKFLIALILVTTQMGAFAQQDYQLNVKKSKVFWNNQKKMGGHYGYLLFNSGTLNYSSAAKPLSGVFSMNMNSIRSTDHDTEAANQKVDKELRTEDFFAVEKHPTATIDVKKIQGTTDPELFKVQGNLMIKGITNPVEFVAKIVRKENTVTVTAETLIDRLKWNIHANPPASKVSVWDFGTVLKNKIMSEDIAITLNLVFER